MWLNGLSQQEKAEMFLDLLQAFSTDVITEKEFRESLAKLGYNATDIEDLVRSPKP